MIRWHLSLLVIFFWMMGCASASPLPAGELIPQISRGRPVAPLDFLGNVLAVPGKLILWNRKFANHAISGKTEMAVADYIHSSHSEALSDTKFRLNEYCPLKDMKALVKNRHVAWPYRFTLGLITTLLWFGPWHSLQFGDPDAPLHQASDS